MVHKSPEQDKISVIFSSSRRGAIFSSSQALAAESPMMAGAKRATSMKRFILMTWVDYIYYKEELDIKRQVERSSRVIWQERRKSRKPYFCNTIMGGGECNVHLDFKSNLVLGDALSIAHFCLLVCLLFSCSRLRESCNPFVRNDSWCEFACPFPRRLVILRQIYRSFIGGKHMGLLMLDKFSIL